MKISRSCSLIVICLGFFFITTPAWAEVQGVNEAALVLCQIIQFLRGRLGRAISLIAILSIGLLFYLGKVEMKTLPVFVIGLGLFYGAEGLVYLILPSTIKGIHGVASDGTIFLPNKEYSPEEVVSTVCPALTM